MVEENEHRRRLADRSWQGRPIFFLFRDDVPDTLQGFVEAVAMAAHHYDSFTCEELRSSRDCSSTYCHPTNHRFQTSFEHPGYLDWTLAVALRARLLPPPPYPSEQVRS